MWWPSESLISLKRSTSSISTAKSVPSRRADAIARSIRSRNSVRLARPVSSSCSAWCLFSSACRTSASSADFRVVMSSTIEIANAGRPSGSRTSCVCTCVQITLPSLRIIRFSSRYDSRRPATSSRIASRLDDRSSGCVYWSTPIRPSSSVV